MVALLGDCTLERCDAPLDLVRFDDAHLSRERLQLEFAPARTGQRLGLKRYLATRLLETQALSPCGLDDPLRFSLR